MRRLTLTILAVLLPVVPFMSGAGADDSHSKRKAREFEAKMNGFNEVNGGTGGTAVGSVSTNGSGTLELKIVDDDPMTGLIEFKLRYKLDFPATVAHVHFAQRHVGGGVVFFFCGGGGKPACPPGDVMEAEVTGTVVPADIVSSTAAISQGINVGEFAETVRAIRAGAAYANVHSTRWPAGEIRGQLERDRHKDKDDKDKDDKDKNDKDRDHR